MVHERWARFFGKVVTAKYQILLFCITSVIMVSLFIKPFYRFVSLEPAPTLHSVTPKQVKQWGGNAVSVIVGLHIVNFPRFDMVRNDFIIDAIVWFEYDPALISLEIIEKFSFEKGDILKKSSSDTRVIDGRFFVEYNVTVQFTTNLAFQFFPIDDHRIFLTLTNKFVNPSEIVFESYLSGFTISDSVFVTGWRITDRHVAAGYSESYLDENDPKKVVLNPKVLFSIDFTRYGFQQVFLIFLPLFLMLFTGIFSFALNIVTERSLVLTLSLGSLSAILSYRFVIQNMSPHTGYFLLSDFMFLFVLSFAVIVFMINLICMSYDILSPYLTIMRGVAYLVLYLLQIIIWYYLLYRWNT